MAGCGQGLTKNIVRPLCQRVRPQTLLQCIELIRHKQALPRPLPMEA